jgi:hypothetical protein
MKFKLLLFLNMISPCISKAEDEEPLRKLHWSRQRIAETRDNFVALVEEGEIVVPDVKRAIGKENN